MESSHYPLNHMGQDEEKHIMFANTTYHQKLDDLISDLPAKCNPAKMGKIRQNKKLNKKNGIVWIKKRACRRWLGGVIQWKWDWPASKYQNWQSKSATAHPRGQGSRSERKGWIEKENTLASQGWSFDPGEKDIGWNPKGWGKKSKKVRRGNNWRDGTTEQSWNQEGGGKEFGQGVWQENRGSRQGTGQGEVARRQEMGQEARVQEMGQGARGEAIGYGTRRQDTKQGWKAGQLNKLGDQNSWKGSGTNKQNTWDQKRRGAVWTPGGRNNTGEQLFDQGWDQVIRDGHGWTAVKKTDYY